MKMTASGRWEPPNSPISMAPDAKITAARRGQKRTGTGVARMSAYGESSRSPLP